MEWLPMYEELEKAVGGRRNWLDMMIVYLRKFADEHRDFALSVNRLLRDMNECCLDIEMASEMEAFLLKLMDEEPFHRRVFGIDVGQRVIWKKVRFKLGRNLLSFGDTWSACYDLTTHLCIHRDENNGAMEWSPRCEKLEKAVGGRRWMDMMIELQSVVGEAAPTKTAVFLEKMIENQEVLPICDELRRAISTADWEPQFILYYQRAMGEDQRLAWQINALCDTLTDVIERRENFVAELDMLVIKFVPGKMAEFMKETLNKDVPNLMKLQILRREFKPRAHEKDLFIEKLKVSCRSSIDSMAGVDVDDGVLMSSAMNSPAPFALDDSFCFSIDSVAGADVDDGVPTI
nr:hypothetical protein [Tanacetum cinerariifolium]